MIAIQALARDFQTVPYRGDLAIICDGINSLAMGSVISLAGHNVRVWSPEGEAPLECEVRKRQDSGGAVRGKTRFVCVSEDLSSVLKGAGGIILSAAVREYQLLVSKLGPHLSNSHTIILTEAPLGAALQFSRELAQLYPGLRPCIIEMGSVFDVVEFDNGLIVATGPRQKVSVSGISRNDTRKGLTLASSVWTGLVPASNILERGLSEMDRALAPMIHLFRTIAPEADSERVLPKLLTDGFMRILNGFDAEVQLVTKAFGVVAPPLGQALSAYSGAVGTSLRERILSLEPTLMSRANKETMEKEVRETVCVIASLAGLARLRVPMIDSVIELASAVSEKDLRKEGLGLVDLGLLGYDVEEIVELINS